MKDENIQLKDSPSLAKKLAEKEFEIQSLKYRIDREGELFSHTVDKLHGLQSGIRKSRMYLDTVVNSMVDALVVVTPDAVIETINQSALALLGYKEEDLIGKPVAIIFAEEVTLFEGTEMEELLKEGSVRNYETNYKTKSGEKIPIRFFSSVMKDKDGNLIGIVGIAHDMREIMSFVEKEKESAATIAVADAKVDYVEEMRKKIRSRAFDLEEEVQKKTKQVQSKVDKLEKFYKLTVGRDLKVIELEDKIKELEHTDKSKE
jgi:PAS domain S-box-containing protein